MAFNAVRLSLLLGVGEQNGKLATSARGDNVRPANGSIVDNGGCLNIVNGALAGLVVGREAP